MSLEKIALEIFLKRLNLENIPHVRNQSILSHFLRVSSILNDLGATHEVQLAGMCHSVYSSQEYNKKIITEKADKTMLRTLIGEYSEKLVYLFSIIDRKNFGLAEGSYCFFSLEGQKIDLLEREYVDLSLILIANEVDHLTVVNQKNIVRNIKNYILDMKVFPEKTITYLQNLDASFKPLPERYIQYLGHAGFLIKEQESAVLLDPWLYASTLEMPVIYGLGQNQKTIDFHTMPTSLTIKEISADLILLSHLHTHHSPIREIKEIATLRKVKIICPPMPLSYLETLEKNMGQEIYKNISFEFVDKDVKIRHKDIEVMCFVHTQKNHLGFEISVADKKIIHLSDAIASENFSPALSKLWNKLENSQPDYFFVSAAGHDQKFFINGEREIKEFTSLSPVQAAKLCRIIRPKNVALMGYQNYSIWDKNVEYAMSDEDISGKFLWAMDFLCPTSKILTLRAGEVVSA